jgi:hypothetical protein
MESQDPQLNKTQPRTALRAAAERLIVGQQRTPMGLYATLESGAVACPGCGNVCTGDWQFHFGSVSELPRYRLGDQIEWSGSDWFGCPAMTLVHALAYSVNDPACASCGAASLIAELVIRAGVVASLDSARAGTQPAELLYEGESRGPRYYDELHRMPG